MWILEAGQTGSRNPRRRPLHAAPADRPRRGRDGVPRAGQRERVPARRLHQAPLGTLAPEHAPRASRGGTAAHERAPRQRRVAVRRGEEGEAHGRLPFLVLELIDGMDLRAMCRALYGSGSRRMPPSRLGRLLPDLIAVHVACAVLARARRRAARDPGPRSPRRHAAQHPRLERGRDKARRLRDRRRHGRRVEPSAQAAVKGKFGYMAPEQMRGEPLDVRTDLFAVGVLVYELLAKVRPCSPMQGMDEVCATRARGHCPTRPPSSEARSRAARRASGCSRMRREDRFSCADDALRALAPFSAGEMGSLRLAALLRRSRERVDAERPAGGGPARARATRSPTRARGRHRDAVVSGDEATTASDAKRRVSA